MSRNEVKIPIIKDGCDICRLIFTRFDNGLFDVKIDSLGKDFSIQTHKLFSHRPDEIMEDGRVISASHDISYHHGMSDKPVVVHVKNRNAKKGEKRYTDLPLTNLLPPTENNDFPLPLLKIEIPNKCIGASKKYKEKKYHHKVDVLNSNVVEIYMTNEKFTNTIEQYSRAWLIYMNLSFEYFSTNTILSGSQKMNSYMPVEPEVRSIYINDMSGVSFIINIYPEPRLDKYRKELQFTFIENKYTEEILLNTILVYPPVDADGTFPSCFMGGCTLGDLSVLAGKVEPDKSTSKFGLIDTGAGEIRRRYTVAQALVFMDNLQMNKWGYLIRKSLSASEQLYALMADDSIRKDRKREELQVKCIKFIEVLKKLRHKSKNELENDVYLWFQEDNAYKEESIYLMLSLFLELRDYRLGVCLIDATILHMWLLYDMNWDISVCGDIFNRFVDEGDLFPNVYVNIGFDPCFTTPSPREDISRIKDKIQVKPIGYKRVLYEDRESMLDQNDGLLRRVWETIKTAIN